MYQVREGCCSFQSTLPARGATRCYSPHQCSRWNFNPRSPRGERHLGDHVSHLVIVISIHAPREGSDLQRNARETIRALFQSTLPARGATSTRGHLKISRLISIHAPREGSDSSITPSTTVETVFQSTLPARGATVAVLNAVNGIVISIHAPREGSDFPIHDPRISILISIHAPREGSDPALSMPSTRSCYFNPRSPRGERQQMCTNIHLQACKTSIKFNLAPQKPSNHTALILRKKGAVLVRSSQVMYGH